MRRRTIIVHFACFRMLITACGVQHLSQYRPVKVFFWQAARHIVWSGHLKGLSRSGSVAEQHIAKRLLKFLCAGICELTLKCMYETYRSCWQMLEKIQWPRRWVPRMARHPLPMSRWSLQDLGTYRGHLCHFGTRTWIVNMKPAIFHWKGTVRGQRINSGYTKV